MRRRASFDSSCWRQTPAASNGARPQWRSHAVSTFDEQNWAVSVSAINLDNYAYPLAYRIKDPGLVSVWCTKQHSEQSFVRIEAAREIPPQSRDCWSRERPRRPRLSPTRSRSTPPSLARQNCQRDRSGLNSPSWSVQARNWLNL